MSALDTGLVSRTVGYKLTKGNFAENSPNLPQRIAIIGEANTANQGSLSTTGTQITSAQQAGQLYGYGSPLYHMARILFPLSGGGVGSIPVFVYPQLEPAGAASKIVTVSPSGTATGNAVHTLRIAGRQGIDGQFYDFNVEVGDTVADITAKIADVINGVLGSPVTATDTTYEVECESKWAGATADALTIDVLTNNTPVGIAYSVASTQSGSGTPASIAGALNQFGEAWVTLLLNGYGTNTSICSALEAFNGIPDPENPTGRYAAILWKPFVAVTGSTAADPSAFTDARSTQVTIALAPAPNSPGFQFEAAANMLAIFAPKMQNSPHLDVSGQNYPDMPAPASGDIGAMASYTNRDLFVKKGCSTVKLVAGSYEVQDFVTTYHPAGELVPQYRYVRNLVGVDFNVRFGYFLLEQTNVVDHVIAADNDTVSASKVIKPKQFKGLLVSYFNELVLRGLATDAAFSEAATTVSLSTTNPDRLEVFFRYKRSGTARIVSTEAQAGFNFGTL